MISMTNLVVLLDFRIVDGNYYGLYKTSSSRQYLLFIRGVRDLSELDQNLLGLFVNNSSIAIDNLQATEDEREAQRELLYSVGEAIEKHSIDEISHHVKQNRNYFSSPVISWWNERAARNNWC